MDRASGYGYGTHRGNGSRNHGDRRSESPDARGGRHEKRKRDNDERRDKDERREKKEKHKVKEDRGHREDKPQMKEERSQKEDTAQKDERAHKERAQSKDVKSHRGREAPLDEKEPPRREKERERSPPPAQAGKKGWRDEAEHKSDDERDLSDDEEEAERKRVEARRRRQELMKKAAEKQSAEKTPEQEAAPVEKSSQEAPAAKEQAGEDPLPSNSNSQSPEDTGGGMFDDSAAAGTELLKQVKQTAAIGVTGASGDDWDDDEGYYVPKLDELMDDRYFVLETAAGKGVFSGVVKAQDRRGSGEAVAVKVIRANDRMTKAAELEVALLKRLNAADKDGSSHIIKLHDTFVYRKHFCLVFECMWGDLRSALKTFTKNKGMTLLAVRSYTKQLLSACKHMMKCKIIHCDIKPDNILISKGHNAVKFCDLGTAVELSGINATPYLGSGYYRAPEIVLGCDWCYPIDTWALAATLVEIFSGKILMPSKSNNQHLKLIMEYKGKIPGKVIKKGTPLVWKNHFTDELDFKFAEESKLAKEMPVDDDAGDAEPEKVIRLITDLAAKRSLKDVCMERVGPEKRQSEKLEDRDYVRRAGQFADLLELMLALDPDKRITPSDALQQPFCQDLRPKRT